MKMNIRDDQAFQIHKTATDTIMTFEGHPTIEIETERDERVATVTPDDTRTMSTIMEQAVKEIKDRFGVDVLDVRVEHYRHANAIGRIIRLGVSDIKVEVAL